MRNFLSSFCVSATLAAAALAGCGGSNNGTTDGPVNMDMAAPQGPCTSGAICTNTTVTDQTLNLFEQDPNGALMINVLANPGYSGTINATIVRDSINALPGGMEPSVHIAAVPPSFQLTGGGNPMPVTLHLGTGTDAAAFDAQPVTVHFQDSVDSTKAFDVKFNLTVTNTLNITLTVQGNPASAGSHTWSTDTAATLNGNNFTIDVRQRPVTGSGATVKGGTNFVWHNADTVTAHEVHCDNPLIHENSGGSNSGNQPANNPTIMATNGGTYSNVAINVTSATPMISGGFYCHTHGQNTSVNGLIRGIRWVP